MPAIITDYTSLYSLVIAELAGVPMPLMSQQFSLIGREFCRATEAWVEYLSPVNIKTDIVRYALPMDYDVMVRRILSVRINGHNSHPIHPSQYEYVDGENTIILRHKPTADIANGLIVEVVLVPFLYSTVLSATFLEKWGEGIAAGVKSAFMIMKNKTWSDPDRAAVYRRDYLSAQADARFDKTHKNKRDNVAVSYNEWAV